MPLQLRRGDLFTARTQAIVSPAPADLACPSHFGSPETVRGQLFALADRERLESACAALAPCPVGEAAATDGCGLPYAHILHAVTPRWSQGSQNERGQLASAYRAALRLCLRLEINSVAFPLLGAGSNRFPPMEAYQTAIRAIRSFLDEEDADGSLSVELYIRRSIPSAAYPELARSVIHALIAPDFMEQRDLAPKAGMLPMADAAGPKESVFSRRKSVRETKRPARKPEPPARADRAEQSRPRTELDEPALAEICGCPSAPLPPMERVEPDEDVLERIRESAREAAGWEETFTDRLLHLIDASGETDAAVYKRANVDRRLFSKIRSDRRYRPSKNTVFAFCVALRLSCGEAAELLKRAGLAFSGADVTDQVVQRCLRLRLWDVDVINGILFDLDLPGLGM